jgi:sensor c-di-GMP phosphodiesterase-like protein
MRQVASEIATRWRRSAAIDRTLPLLVTLLVIAPMIASVFVPVSRPAATVVVLSSPVLLLVLFAIHRRAALRCGLIGLRVCRALRRGQLYRVYQPKICLETGRPVGVEALLRWDHPRKGAIAPSTYVGDLEGGVFARSLDSFVLRQAVRQAKALADADAAIPVAVN